MPNKRWSSKLISKWRSQISINNNHNSRNNNIFLSLGLPFLMFTSFSVTQPLSCFVCLSVFLFLCLSFIHSLGLDFSLFHSLSVCLAFRLSLLLSWFVAVFVVVFRIFERTSFSVGSGAGKIANSVTSGLDEEPPSCAVLHASLGCFCH